MIILGAGLAGLLAARRLIHWDPIIYEQQKELPNNHSALLRFRSSIVGDAIGVPFKEVTVYKGVLLDDETITNSPTIREYNAYSIKSTGGAYNRSITNIANVSRYIAPYDLVKTCSIGADIKYEHNAESLLRGTKIEQPIISTIPMPDLMRILDYPRQPKFETKKIWTINCDLLGVDVYQTLYVPYGEYEPYRVSITGNRMTMEFAHKPDCSDIIDDHIKKYLGLMFDINHIDITNVIEKEQQYGKIVPINDYERQKFILWATDKFNIYSLGRYATWRQILLDDVMGDIDVISRFISQRQIRSGHYGYFPT
jgi:hypothetical protein